MLNDFTVYKNKNNIFNELLIKIEQMDAPKEQREQVMKLVHNVRNAIINLKNGHDKVGEYYDGAYEVLEQVLHMGEF